MLIGTDWGQMWIQARLGWAERGVLKQQLMAVLAHYGGFRFWYRKEALAGAPRKQKQPQTSRIRELRESNLSSARFKRFKDFHTVDTRQSRWGRGSGERCETSNHKDVESQL